MRQMTVSYNTNKVFWFSKDDMPEALTDFWISQRLYEMVLPYRRKETQEAEMRVLITVPNEPGFPAGVLDCDSGRFSGVPGSDEWGGCGRGIDRCPVTNRLVIGVDRSGRGALLLVSEDDYIVEDDIPLDGVMDIHDVKWSGPELVLVVSSGNDRVFSYDVGAHEWAVISSLHSEEHDSRHRNSIARHQDTWGVSEFGPKGSDGWRSAVDGSVRHLNDPSAVLGRRPIAHPHSLLPVGDSLLVCESGTGSVIDATTHEVICMVPGYARGMAHSAGENCLYVGVSCHRPVAKHTGAPVGSPENGLAMWFPAGVFKIDLEERRIIGFWALQNPRAIEIYGLVLLD